MLRSWSNTLVGVQEQVTQRNTGRRTAGIDGLVALTSQARAEMAVQVHASIGSRRRLPRSGGCMYRRPVIRQKCSGFGIPVIADRCHMARG